MKLNFKTINPCQANNPDSQNRQSVPSSKYPNLSPLKQDTVSFKGAKKGNTQKVKKSDFKGIDHVVLEKFRVNISPFKSTDDLQTWASEKIENDILNNDFKARDDEATKERNKIVKEWVNYLTKENKAYTPTMQLFVLDAITKDLKKNTNDVPVRLNKGVLAETMTEIFDRLNDNPKDIVNFHKVYETKLKGFYYGKDEDGKPKTDFTGWVVIPSKKHDKANFKNNVEKLKALSHKNWCTKTFNAEPYLSEGDFHVYLENGQPKIGVRFEGDVIHEIQGERNNSKIPVVRYKQVQEYIKDNKFKLSDLADEEMDKAEETYGLYLDLKDKFGEDVIKRSNPAEILPTFGIHVKKCQDGMYIISHYKQPSYDIGFEDFGINENDMFKKVKGISGDADFENSSLNSLNSVKKIGGIARFSYSQIESLGELKKIGGSLILEDSRINNLGQLREIGGDVDFTYCRLDDIGELTTIGGNANFANSSIKSLGNLKSIGGNAKFKGSDVEDLGALEEIGYQANFEYSLVKNLGNLKTIGSDASFRDSELKDLGNLEEIGGDADFSYTGLNNIGKLRFIGGSIFADECPLDAEEIEKTIAGDDYEKSYTFNDDDDDYYSIGGFGSDPYDRIYGNEIDYFE